MTTWAAIFDWDGVIVDSAAAHEASWERLAAEAQLALPEGHFIRGFGMKNEIIIPELLGWTSDPARIRVLSDRKEALYREIIAERGIQPVPGVVPWLDALREAGTVCAIASSTPRANIDAVLERLGLASRFAAMVTAEDVRRGKPDPQVFLLAAQRIGYPPAACVVFEDTAVGLQAARAGGMRSIGITTTHPRDRLAAADRIVSRLDELTVRDLADWFPSNRF